MWHQFQYSELILPLSHSKIIIQTNMTTQCFLTDKQHQLVIVHLWVDSRQSDVPDELSES